jgi:hypothetical protein
MSQERQGRPCKNEREEALQGLEKQLALLIDAAIPDFTEPDAQISAKNTKKKERHHETRRD